MDKESDGEVVVKNLQDGRNGARRVVLLIRCFSYDGRYFGVCCAPARVELDKAKRRKT